jgi:hypothetical protein
LFRRIEPGFGNVMPDLQPRHNHQREQHARPQANIRPSTQDCPRIRTAASFE